MDAVVGAGARAGEAGPVGGDAAGAIGGVRRLIERAGGGLAVAEVAALLVAAPLLVFPNRYSPLALGLLPVVWLVRMIARRRTIRRKPTDWPLVGLLLMTSVSLYPSVDLDLSRPKLYGLILGFYFFTLLGEHLRTPLGRKALAGLLVLGGFGVALGGLVGTDWQVGKIPVVESIHARLPRLVTGVQSSFGTVDRGFIPNEVGGTLALLLPLALALALFCRGRLVRLGSAAAALLMAGTLVLTLSRSGLAGVAVAAGALVIGRWPRLAFGLPLVGAGLAGAGWRIGVDRIVGSLLAMETATGASAEGRLEVWSRASYMIQDFPFTGIGLNTFPVVANLLYPFFIAGPDARVNHAHNLFLQVAVDLGVIGLLGFVGLLVGASLSLARAWRRSAGWERGLVAGLAAGLLGHLLFGLGDAVTLGAKPGIFLWAMLGGAMALGSPAVETAGNRCEARLRGLGGRGGAGGGDEPAGGSGRDQPGAGVLPWVLWALFTLACGLGILIATTGIKMLP